MVSGYFAFHVPQLAIGNRKSKIVEVFIFFTILAKRSGYENNTDPTDFDADYGSLCHQ